MSCHWISAVTFAHDADCYPWLRKCRPDPVPERVPLDERRNAFNRILDILAELEPDERVPVLEAVRVALEVMK